MSVNYASRRSTGSWRWPPWSRPSAPGPRSRGTRWPSRGSAALCAAPALTAWATTAWEWRRPLRHWRPARESAASSLDSVPSRPAIPRSPKTSSDSSSARPRLGRCLSPSTGRPGPASQPFPGRLPSGWAWHGWTRVPCTGPSLPSRSNKGRHPRTSRRSPLWPRRRPLRWGSG